MFRYWVLDRIRLNDRDIIRFWSLVIGYQTR